MLHVFEGIRLPFEYSSFYSIVLQMFISIKPTSEVVSRVRLFATPWTVTYQAPPFMEFSRPEYWSGLPFSSSGDLPDPGIEPRSPAFALPSEPSVRSLFTG